MACSEKYRAEPEGQPTDDPAQPSEVRVCDGADQVSKLRRHHEPSGTPTPKAMPEPEEEGSCQSHLIEGVKKRGRGRPVIYQGDPNAPGLEPEQRRLLQRRISNRESAQRTRKRHQDQAANLYAKAKSLQRNCNILAAQVDALELRCSQSEAVEKDMTEALHIKDKQVVAFKRKSDAMQRVANNLMLRLYIKEQEQQPGMCHGVDCCRPALNSLYLQRTDVTRGSGRPSQNRDPFVPSDNAAEESGGFLPDLDYAVGQSLYQAAFAGEQANPTCGFDMHAPCELLSSLSCELPPPALSAMDMELPAISSLSDDTGGAYANFEYMMTELGLLENGETSTIIATS